jgi:hypothetical protein
LALNDRLAHGYCQVVAIGAALLCAFFWRYTATFDFGAGKLHLHRDGTAGVSVFIVAATVLAGGAGCLSNVTFWVMCSRYSGTHTETAMSVGSTVGGLLLATIANGAQRAGADPRFSAQTFMLAVAAVQVLFRAPMVGGPGGSTEPPGSLLHLVGSVL